MSRPPHRLSPHPNVLLRGVFGLIHLASDRVQWLLGYRGVPMMARPTLRNDLISTLFLGLATGILNPQFTQVFLRKGLSGAPWMVAALQTQYAAGGLLVGVLGAFFQRRRRVVWVVCARVIIAGGMAAAALLPRDAASAAPFLALMLFSAVLAMVALNLMAGVWHSNYAEGTRGVIFARRFAMHTLAMICSVKLAGYALDAWAWGHQIIYAAGAACLLASAYYYSRIRVRGEPGVLQKSVVRRFRPLEGFSLLRRDRYYARYLAWQMFAGCVIMAISPVFALVLTDYLKVDYAAATTARGLATGLVCLVTALVCGRLFDSVGIMRYRAIGALSWGCSAAVLLVGLVIESWAVVLVGFGIIGLSQAVGSVAFCIGHTRFAPQNQTDLYMSVHLVFMGVRGLTMPFVGVWAYNQPWGGIWLLGLAAGLQAVAALGFMLCPPVEDRRDVTAVRCQQVA